MKFLDANIFIRYLAGDDEAKTYACGRIFERLATSDESATTSEAVIAEVVYVMSARAHYGLPATEITARLRPLVDLPGIALDHKRALLRALDFYETYPIDFEDALSLAHMERQGISEILSYDTDFDRVDDVTREEP